LAEPIRLLLHYVGQQYEDKMYEQGDGMSAAARRFARTHLCLSFIGDLTLCWLQQHHVACGNHPLIP